MTTVNGITFVTVRSKPPYTPGWSQLVEYGGKRYYVAVFGARKVRIAYRGRQMGWQWNGHVRDENGCELWCDRVPGSLGAKGLLERAGIIPRPLRVLS